MIDPGSSQRELGHRVVVAGPDGPRVVGRRLWEQGVGVARGQGGLAMAEHALRVGAVEREAGEELRGHASPAARVEERAAGAGATARRLAEAQEELAGAPHAGE